MKLPMSQTASLTPHGMFILEKPFLETSIQVVSGKDGEILYDEDTAQHTQIIAHSIPTYETL